MYFHMNFEPYRQCGIRCFCFVLQHSFIHSFKTPTSIFTFEFVFQIIKKIGNDENYNLLRKKRAIQLRLLDEK
jgi:hypothetical protein